MQAHESPESGGGENTAEGEHRFTEITLLTKDIKSMRKVYNLSQPVIFEG